jgi:hypothetical protein
MRPVIRDLLLLDIGPAVRLLEDSSDWCRRERSHVTSGDLIAAVERTPASVTDDIRDRFGDEVDRFARV